MVLDEVLQPGTPPCRLLPTGMALRAASSISGWARPSSSPTAL